jgi:hypothetical protein
MKRGLANGVALVYRWRLSKQSSRRKRRGGRRGEMVIKAEGVALSA